jgi:hypothetical protein
LSSQKESFTATLADGRVVLITIDRRELVSTMVHRLNKDRKTNAGRVKPQKVVALEGGVSAEWVQS